MSSSSQVVTRVARWAPVALIACLLLAYLPSLSGGFLNWDDPWLIVDNPVLRDGSLAGLVRIWFDWSTQARLELGAEYLPLRDTSFWLEARLWGLEPQFLRWSNWAIYAAAVLCFRAALRSTLPAPTMAEIAAWVFALHPVHVESVAWLAGRKDVLALLFLGAGFWAYSSPSRSGRWWVVPCFALAHFSKSMSIVAVGLLVAQDLLGRRRPDWRIYCVCLVVAIVSLALHLHVGASVSMTGDPVGGSRLSAAFTMGPVWLSYLWMLIWPGALSLVHDVEILTEPSLRSALGYLALVGWGALAAALAWRHRSQSPRAQLQLGHVLLAAWLWFLIPLVTVSQVFLPLQNLMADRYLFLSVMALAVLLGWLCCRALRYAPAVGAVCALALGVTTAERAHLFSDSALVFLDATAKTTRSTLAPYQAALALHDQGMLAEAELAYRVVLERDQGASGPARRATNNLARLLVQTDQAEQARELLLRGVERWPDDPKMFSNLIKVLVRVGRTEEARQRHQLLLQRFPDYDPSRDHGVLRHIDGD